MTARCCLLDPFHDAPDVAQVRGCLRKLLNHQHARSLGQRPSAEVSWLTLRRAITDLQGTPPGPVRDALVRREVELHHDRQVRDPHAPEDEDELMRSLPFVEELERRCRTEGRTEGAHVARVRYVERSLGRVTTEAERDALRHGLMRRGDAMLDEVFALSPAALDAWLIRQPS